ncbi:MFS transporter [Microbacterium sp. p3-SID336]|uniref:MFS transporter n=1 Tax=Microbacterium sp. p3-SID336 TaxID=2916212 RepID=UPI0021A95E29|nr:MFS transporter [Microbacterium sp. p3-SID336]MCT1478970.1 MFS transporter [Microbacterium sp. p3-SID336]
MSSPSTSIPAGGSWRELLGSRYAPVAAVLAGGVLLEASNVYLTTSLLPTIVADIGGAAFYAWTMMTFLLASVVSSMLVSRILTQQGAVRAYLLALGLFALGSALCAASPWMSALLAGRAVQGLGGGLLAGLGYALIQRALPERLWARGAALVSAMWGVGNIVGPVVGGIFAQLDAWRVTFVGLAVVSALIGIVVVRALPQTTRTRSRESVPWASLVLLAGGVAAVGIASVVPAGLGTAVALVVGAALGLWFLRHEKHGRRGILPRVTFAHGSSLGWVYLTVAVLAFAIGTEAFIPLFGQQVGGLAPFVAGLLGAALSLGWSLTQVFTANATGIPSRRTLIVTGPLVVALGLAAYGLLQHAGPSVLVVVFWFVTLFIAGAGIGLGFPHLTVAALGSTRDEEEGAKAAAAVNTVFIIASAFSAAMAGVLVNLALPDTAGAARLLMLVFAGVTVLGVFVARGASRGIGVRTEDEGTDDRGADEAAPRGVPGIG